jgi:hypothetical protein
MRNQRIKYCVRRHLRTSVDATESRSWVVLVALLVAERWVQFVTMQTDTGRFDDGCADQPDRMIESESLSRAVVVWLYTMICRLAVATGEHAPIVRGGCLLDRCRLMAIRRML